MFTGSVQLAKDLQERAVTTVSCLWPSRGDRIGHSEKQNAGYGIKFVL